MTYPKDWVKKKRGRPPKVKIPELKPEPGALKSSQLLRIKLFEKIIKEIRDGNHPSQVMLANGFGESTFYNWMTKGKKGIEPYQAFAIAVKKAEAECEADCVKILKRAIPSDPKLALQFLERRFPKRWGRGITVWTIREEAAELMQLLGIEDTEMAEVLKAAEEIVQEAKETGQLL